MIPHFSKYVKIIRDRRQTTDDYEGVSGSEIKVNTRQSDSLNSKPAGGIVFQSDSLNSQPAAGMPVKPAE